MDYSNYEEIDSISQNKEKRNNITKVTNLSTLEERHYDLEPEVAVKTAYLQSRSNYNTWQYDHVHVRIIQGRSTISCGDWTAMKLEIVKENVAS